MGKYVDMRSRRAREELVGASIAWTTPRGAREEGVVEAVVGPAYVIDRRTVLMATMRDVEIIEE